MLASRSEGLRIAQYVETSNAESPTQMYGYPNRPALDSDMGCQDTTHPIGRFPLLGF